METMLNASASARQAIRADMRLMPLWAPELPKTHRNGAVGALGGQGLRGAPTTKPERRDKEATVERDVRISALRGVATAFQSRCKILGFAGQPRPGGNRGKQCVRNSSSSRRLFLHCSVRGMPPRPATSCLAPAQD